MICPGFSQPPIQRPRPRLVCTVIAAGPSVPVSVPAGPWRPVVVKGGRAS